MINCSACSVSVRCFMSVNRKEVISRNPVNPDQKTLQSVSLSKEPPSTQPRAANAKKENVSRAAVWAARVGFFAGGFTVASWAPLIPFVQSSLGLTPAVLGFLLLGLGTGSFIGMPMSHFIISRFGCKLSITVSGLLSCLLLVALALMPGFWFEGAALFLYGVTLGCLEVSVNLYGTHLEKVSGQRLLSGLHASYSIGEVVAAGLMTLLLVSGLAPLAAVALMMALMAAALLVARRHIPDEKLARPEKKERSEGSFLSPAVFALASVCIVIFLVEGAMLDWSALYLRDFGGVAQEQSPLGYTFFVVAMAVSRLLGDGLTNRFGVKAMLLGGIGVMVLAFAFIVFYPTPVVLYLSLFFMGLGIANIAPVIISSSARVAGVNALGAVTAVTTAGYGGLFVGPAVVGTTASFITLQGAFALLGALLLVSLAMVFKITADRRYKAIL